MQVRVLPPELCPCRLDGPGCLVLSQETGVRISAGTLEARSATSQAGALSRRRSRGSTGKAHNARGADEGKKLSPGVGWSVLRAIIRVRFSSASATEHRAVTPVAADGDDLR